MNTHIKHITIVGITLLFLFTSCRERQRIGAFQGVWYKDGFDKRAFTVRADSLYFPGLKSGYFYEMKQDTLFIEFTERKTKSKILSFSSDEIMVWDMTLTKDTILLLRKPSIMLDTLLSEG